MIEIEFVPVSSELRSARRALRTNLDGERLGADHVGAVEAVANELLGAACAGDVTEELVLRVETFPRLTSVRVHCPRNVQLRDDPFGVRERVLGGFAFAWGKRRHTDGSVDLWAELARPSATVAVQ
ncbi:MAG TPA: hypothetical protein VGI86_07245 [Acidimicrobiia bacterium]